MLQGSESINVYFVTTSSHPGHGEVLLDHAWAVDGAVAAAATAPHRSQEVAVGGAGQVMHLNLTNITAS